MGTAETLVRRLAVAPDVERVLELDLAVTVWPGGNAWGVLASATRSGLVIEALAAHLGIDPITLDRLVDGGPAVLLSFAEGVFFPIPPDVILMPLVLANRDRAWRYAGVTVIASVLGGSTGYAVGYFLRPVGAWLLAHTGPAGSEAFIQELFTKGDLEAVDRYLDPGFVNHDAPFPGAPDGPEGMRQAAVMFR